MRIRGKWGTAYPIPALRFLVALAAMAGPALAGPRFQGLGDLPGGYYESYALGISADGSVVVGHSWSVSSRPEAFRWTQGTGMVGLGGFSSGLSSSARGVSADGAVVVGWGDCGSGSRAFRWTQGTGMVDLGCLTGGTGSSAYGVSADGEVVVGSSGSASGSQVFRWTQGAGMVGLGYLPGWNQSNAMAVSADGAVVVGYDVAWPERQAVRWTQSTGMVGLGYLSSGYLWSAASAASADGSIVVGASCCAQGSSEAFRWTENARMLGLGFLPGKQASQACGVSGDGSVIVGESHRIDPDQDDYDYEAFLWTPVDGMRDLRDLLVTTCGLDVTGWRLTAATGISADGLTITGYGSNPRGDVEGWIATIPEPTALGLLGFGFVAAVRRRRRKPPSGS